MQREMSQSDIHWSRTVDSPLGSLTLVASAKGLRAVLYPGSATPTKLPTQITEDPDQPVLCQAAQQITEYFTGQRTNFNLPLDLRGTPFQMAVWRSLSSIPYGSTLSYSQQATHLGRPKAIRAIGRALGCNPIPIILPCHRIIGTNGMLVGYSGGLHFKRSLLHLEGALN